jgi:hypothetical protein
MELSPLRALLHALLRFTCRHAYVDRTTTWCGHLIRCNACGWVQLQFREGVEDDVATLKALAMHTPEGRAAFTQRAIQRR